MSRDGCVSLPHGAMGLSAVCDLVFPDHFHLLFLKPLKVHFCLTSEDRVFQSLIPT